MSKSDKKAELSKNWIESLSSATQDALNGDTKPALTVDAQEEVPSEGFEEFRDSLSPEAQDWIDNCTDKPVTDTVDASVARYGIVECPDGEWGTQRLYKTPEGLAKRIGELQDTDTVVWCFFGVAIPITRGKQRYILLPGGEEALMIPIFPGGPCKRIPVNLIDTLAIQDDGFIGPEALADTRIIDEKLELKPAGVDDDDDEVDDEDDEDDDD